ncbi:MAG: UDP-glucose 4-epimerase, partial [Alphaproteobacteria bacterium MarineAlpha10_Bin2]
KIRFNEGITKDPVASLHSTASGGNVVKMGKALDRPVPFDEGPRRAGDPERLVADPSLARKELGWEARYMDIDSLIATAASWHESHPEGYGS